MYFIGCGDTPCQLAAQCQHEQLPGSAGTSQDKVTLHVPNTMHDLQNCVRDQYREELNQFKVRLCLDCAGF